MSEGRVFCHGDGANVEKLYHYTACGLDDVYLLDGYTIHETEEGRGVAIDHLDELHRAIAVQLVTHKKRLSPREFRFLRKQMDMTQNELAQLLGIDAQTVARYEKGETSISGPADQLIRFRYIFSILPRDQQLRFVEELNALVEIDEPLSATPARFVRTEEGWREAA
jgi:DNA-binding transcriptional regulator YiaG